MRAVSDICVPDGVHEYLRGRGWDIVRVKDFGFDNQPDENVWEFARSTRRVLVSADYDFRRFRQFPVSNHPGCIMVNITRGLQRGESVTVLAIRILATALPHLPTHAAMRGTRVYLDANRGIHVMRDGTERELYRLT